ncbi:MAG: CDP-diacylglycerol--serine O-phosphatidyltransferase [Bacteroidales bacterium]|nr:CDP-diacylglycerol--serine O-phosphatidyltransferase [Bacteroidales bacterium]
MNLFKHIPNTITSTNLLCGALGVIFTFRGALDIAFYLMLAAAVCDFFDGFSARLLNAYSSVGKELDSLADNISFGLLPAMMLHRRLIEGGATGFVAYIPLIICVFAAIRLAKFNVDERQSENFLGLATPACALWCGSLIYAADHGVMSFAMMLHDTHIIPIASIVLALLMVSEIPMFSLKFKKGSSYNRVRIYFLAMVVAVSIATLILKINWSYIVFLSLTCYILFNILLTLFTLRIVKKDK